MGLPRPPTACPNRLVDALGRAVSALPASWLSPPHTGEVFATIADCERRLRGFCLAEGFDVVRSGGRTGAALGARFSCVFHGKGTRNWQDYVERDEDGRITSRRQRELTRTGQLDCQLSVRVTWKDVGT